MKNKDQSTRFGELDHGDFKRFKTTFHHWISAEGKSTFSSEANRYHIYYSYACPWAHRTILFLQLKKLGAVISSSPVDSILGASGWNFGPPGSVTADPLYQYDFLSRLYLQSDKNYNGRFTVPVLWDKKTKTIVNNESSEIIRILNAEFNQFTDVKTDFYPQELRAEIDEINAYIYENINNGVYRCGFAETQEAYEQAFEHLFTALDLAEKRLINTDYLVGNRLTEADIRLFATLIRFDAVYHYHFKCNLKKIADYPNLTRFLMNILAIEGIRQTIHVSEIKKHYYCSHPRINPLGIIPVGPYLAWDNP